MGRIVKAACLLPSSRSDQKDASAPAASGREVALAEVTEILVSAHASAEAERAAAKDLALPLARKMAEKIIGRAVDLDPSILGEIVGQAMAACQVREGCVVLRVHPEDLPAVDQSRPRWSLKLATTTSVRVVSDPSVGRHGCVVETPVGRLDGRLQTQLDALERALRGAGLGRATKE